MTEILVEMGIACAVAAVLGYILDKFKGARILGGLALVFNALTLVAVLPITQLDSPSHPGIVMIEIAIWSYVLGGFLSYFISKTIGALIVEAFAVGAALVCAYFTVLLGNLHEWLGVLGLLVAMVLVGTLGMGVFSGKILRGKGGPALRNLWFGFCVTCLIGYGVGGRWGTFLIVLPAQLLFWGGLYYLSGYLLPVENDDRARKEEHREQAFRSLLTFALGTNYPFYVVEDWQTRENREQEKPEPRVPGNAFSQLLAGPGIILNACDHVTVTTTGYKLRVTPPGLSFTGRYEEVYTVVDLRPQLRACVVKAETKDGIGVSMFSFMPHQVGTGGRELRLGRSYPYHEKDVLKATFHERAMEHTWKRDAEGLAAEDISQTPWNELVLTIGPPILKDIILNYKCNDLHWPDDPRPRDPRVEIATTFKARLEKAMKPFGVEVIGGGISNIDAPNEVVEQRIRNWEAKWKKRIEIEIGEMKAERIRQSASVWTEGQLQMMDTIARMLDRDDLEISEEALVFQLLDALTKEDPGEARPETTSETLLAESIRRGRWPRQSEGK